MARIDNNHSQIGGTCGNSEQGNKKQPHQISGRDQRACAATSAPKQNPRKNTLTPGGLAILWPMLQLCVGVNPFLAPRRRSRAFLDVLLPFRDTVLVQDGVAASALPPGLCNFDLITSQPQTEQSENTGSSLDPVVWVAMQEDLFGHTFSLHRCLASSGHDFPPPQCLTDAVPSASYFDNDSVCEDMSDEYFFIAALATDERSKLGKTAARLAREKPTPPPSDSVYL